MLAAGAAALAVWPDPAPPPAPARVAAVAPVPGAPVSLAVPSLGIRSPLLRLSLAADRTLEVPADAARAGWWATGPRPGEPGPVVLVGHVDSATGPGVFARLDELEAGDRVTVGLGDGRTATYAVTGRRQFGKGAFPTADVYGAVPRDELRLITCGGRFDRQRRTYEDNLVVTAVRV